MELVETPEPDWAASPLYATVLVLTAVIDMESFLSSEAGDAHTLVRLSVANGWRPRVRALTR